MSRSNLLNLLVLLPNLGSAFYVGHETTRISPAAFSSRTAVYEESTFSRSRISSRQTAQTLHTLGMTSSSSSEDDRPEHEQSLHRSSKSSDEQTSAAGGDHHHPQGSSDEKDFEKKTRMAKAQAEIDRILKGPDPPFDIESEMKRVASIAPPLMQSQVEQELDTKESDMEKDLYQAVKQQDYTKAAKVQREISQLHIDDCGAVLQANSQFYRAFSDKDLMAMESLWLKDGTTTCIHPSCKPLVGAKAVLASWSRMFETTNGSFQRSWMEPHNIRLSVKGSTMAIVTCDEHVYARRFVRGQRRQTELINKLTATNIYRKVNGRWFICHHHASWHADSEASKQALRGGGSAAKQKSRLARPTGEENATPGIDGILGTSNFGPLIGPTGQNKPVKRILMGNLSDILKLNGDIGDILGNGSEDEGNPFISFSRIEDDDEDDDEDDEDEYDIVSEDDDEDDDEQGNERPSVRIVKHFVGGGKVPAKKYSKKKNAVSGAPKDALRQSCITALRGLAERGEISPKQKRILLTDIISCSARGEFSMVEVAYELLCGEGDDKDVAEEEFAEQCRVFAESLAE